LPDKVQRGPECFVSAIVGAGTPVWDYDDEASRSSGVGKRLQNLPLVRATPVPQQDDWKSSAIHMQAIDVQGVFRRIRNTPECLDGSIHD
jgi:hypothetical protein